MPYSFDNGRYDGKRNIVRVSAEIKIHCGIYHQDQSWMDEPQLEWNDCPGYEPRPPYVTDCGQTIYPKKCIHLCQYTCKNESIYENAVYDVLQKMKEFCPGGAPKTKIYHFPAPPGEPN